MKILDVRNPPKDHDSREYIYNGMDCMVTKELKGILLPELDSHALLVYNYERKILGPCMEMMGRGMKVDENARAKNKGLVIEKINSLLRTWNAITESLCGYMVNPNSSHQLKALFYIRLGIPEIISTKGGQVKVTTGIEAIEKIKKTYPRGKFLATLLLKIRDHQKVLEVMDKKIDADGRWRFSINVAGTDTGRFSSSESAFYTGSNIQNVDPALRDIFVPDDGNVINYSDLQGAESRAVAYLSGEKAYIEGVENGDIHTMVAAMVFGFAPERKLADRDFYNGKTYRDISKMCGHASNYLATPRTIATQGGIETAVAEDFQRRYFRAFPRIREWQQNTATLLEKDGYLTTPLGRKRRFWGRLGDDATLRQGLAFVPQSLITDLMALGIYRLWCARLAGVEILAPIHDALVWQGPECKQNVNVPAVLKLLTVPCVVNGHTMTIPLDNEWGYNWGKQEKDKDGKVIGNERGLRKWKSAS